MDSLRGYTADDAKTDYQALCGNTDRFSSKSMIGNVVMDYHFMNARLQTKSAEGFTFDSWITLMGEKPYVKRIIESNVAKGMSILKSQYKAFQVYSRSGCINAFRPIVAKRLYQKYRPTRVLDPCAGWGGRCLAAMAMGIDYIGYDTNTSLAPIYEELRAYPTTSTIQFHNADSATLDASGYDMVFTSPPYCRKGKMVEIYPDAPTYKNQWDFNVRFLFPMIRAAWRGLALGGVLALNLPFYMYDDVVPLLGAADETFNLDNKHRDDYKENIYVWRRTGRELPAVAWPLAEVKPSPTHGLGAFAKVAIPARTRIADYNGTLYTISEFNAKYGSDLSCCYAKRRCNQVVCGKEEPYRSTNLSHFMNESLSPNVELRHGGAYALKDISPGDELFLKYPKDYPRDYELT